MNLAKKRSNNGFTLIELIVVIAVLGILATLVTVSYVIIQKQSRDTKRQNDIIILGNLLESYYTKNGSYPIGCGGDTCSHSGEWTFQAPDIVSVNTQLGTLSTVLNSQNLATIDPLINGTAKPFIGQYYTVSNTSPGYLYRGGQSVDLSFYGDVTIPITQLVENGSSRYCTLQVGLSRTPVGRDVSSYILGYYSESDRNWNLYMGKSGVRPSINSSSDANFCKIIN